MNPRRRRHNRIARRRRRHALDVFMLLSAWAERGDDRLEPDAFVRSMAALAKVHEARYVMQDSVVGKVF